MKRSVSIAVGYLGLVFLFLLILINSIAVVEASVAGSSAFRALPDLWRFVFQSVFRSLAYIAVVLPFALFPFPLIARVWETERFLSMRLLMERSPGAFFRCTKGMLHGTFTFLAVMAPLAAGFAALLGAAAYWKSVPLLFAALVLLNVVLIEHLGAQMISRILLPFLRVLSERTTQRALRLGYEMARRLLPRLIAFAAGALLMIAGILAVTHLSLPELLSLFDGSMVFDVGAFNWFLLVKVLPLAFGSALLLYFLCCLLARGIRERAIERLRWLLEANVTPYRINKLGRAGYFE